MVLLLYLLFVCWLSLVQEFAKGVGGKEAVRIGIEVRDASSRIP